MSFDKWAVVKTPRYGNQVNLGLIEGKLYSVSKQGRQEATVPYTKRVRFYIKKGMLEQITLKPRKKKDQDKKDKTQKKKDVVDSSNTVEEIKKWLDQEGVEYKSSHTKDDLLRIVKEQQ